MARHNKNLQEKQKKKRNSIERLEENKKRTEIEVAVEQQKENEKRQ